MAVRKTKEIRYVRLSENRIQEIEDLVAAWPYETKAFMRARLNQYTPRSSLVRSLFRSLAAFFMPTEDKRFDILKDPEILTDWQMRFSISGQTNPLEAWNKILEKEVSHKDYGYLLHLLDRELSDIHIPDELEAFFEKVYRAFIRKEYISDPELPKAPLLLIVGSTGSGKTATAGRVIETVVFGDLVTPEVDLKRKKDEILAGHPFWKGIEDVDPELASEINRRKRLQYYKRMSRIPVIRTVMKKRIGRHLLELEEQGFKVDYAMVTPNDYQTALAGEPGNYFKKALGDPKETCIRHIEEAHSAFGKAEGGQSGVERQQRTLIDTANIAIDDITSGRRDCLLIATSDQPERFDPAIYRRFMEKGKIIDISEYWKRPENLKAIVLLELLRSDIRICHPDQTACTPNVSTISYDEMDTVVEKMYQIFNERTLKITPAYVRKLISSIIEIKGDFGPAYLEESLLVRNAFELVAKNSYGDLFAKVVDKMDRRIDWEEYIGAVKHGFSEMANNCLYYGVNDEKGVVLNGPPGSGKTFLVRSWLSENVDVHDVTTSASALQDPVNPVEGAVSNMEKVFDIAKMIAPTMVFFDEGDALAPKRSPSGGSPSDKLTNKFLNLIDGEIPLNRVFTVLTTNRLDILDPALIRSKRLKVMEISGDLHTDDIDDIVGRLLAGVPLKDGLDTSDITASARPLCATPADYAAFVEKVLALRNTEYEVLRRFQALAAADTEERLQFIKLNFKTIQGILGAIGAPKSLRSEMKDTTQSLLDRLDGIESLVSSIKGVDTYPLVKSHLLAARREISQSPVKKGRVQLDEFLEAELSQEPQVGFIIGVGANDTSGMLLPIATSLVYGLTAEKIRVTGAVSSATSAAAELDMAVQMTQQSAQEAFTMVENYFQSLEPDVNAARVIGEFLQNYTLHHQLLSASYNVGGPSAGYALAINTLSVLLDLAVYHDFGITGAPWTKGVKRGEVGGSVIIGGHKKKAEKVLQHLRRMYMPVKNYDDLEPDYLEAYWQQDKDILSVTHFGDLVPEVIWFGEGHHAQLSGYIADRIAAKRSASREPGGEPADVHAELAASKATLRRGAETVVRRRLKAIRSYMQTPGVDPHLSMAAIFQHYQTMPPDEGGQRGIASR
jgi:transitional endoplasmic reticulum ATPase